jgi:hypothetical protein
MRSRLYDIIYRINDINNEWRNRNVQNELAEPEWGEYFNLTSVLGEFVLGWRGFNGVRGV